MYRIGLIVLLAMLALLAGVGGGSPGAVTAVPRLKPPGPRPAAVWMCHPGSACLHMLVHQP